MDHLDAVFLEAREMVDRRPAGGFHDLDAGSDDGFPVLVVRNRIDRRQQRQVHAERLVGELLGLLDFSQQFIAGLEHVGGDEPQGAGVGHRRHQVAITHTRHAAHDDGCLDTEHLGDTRLHIQFLHSGLMVPVPQAVGGLPPDKYPAIRDGGHHDFGAGLAHSMVPLAALRSGA